MKQYIHLNKIMLLLCLLTMFNSCNSYAGNSGNGKAITEAEVKQYFTTLWATGASDTQYDITFDSPVKIGDAMQHSTQTGLMADTYPVQVDFTSSSYNKIFPPDNRIILYEYHKGGIYYFYKNQANQWEMVKDGVIETSKMVKP